MIYGNLGAFFNQMHEKQRGHNTCDANDRLSCAGLVA